MHHLIPPMKRLLVARSLGVHARIILNESPRCLEARASRPFSVPTADLSTLPDIPPARHLRRPGPAPGNIMLNTFIRLVDNASRHQDQLVSLMTTWASSVYVKTPLEFLEYYRLFAKLNEAIDVKSLPSHIIESCINKLTLRHRWVHDRIRSLELSIHRYHKLESLVILPDIWAATNKLVDAKKSLHLSELESLRAYNQRDTVIEYLIELIERDHKISIATFLNILEMYAKYGDGDHCTAVFEHMDGRFDSLNEAYSLVVRAYANADDVYNVNLWLEKVKAESSNKDLDVLLCVRELSEASARRGKVEQTLRLLRDISIPEKKNLLRGIKEATCETVIQELAHAGHIKEAKQIFESIKSRSGDSGMMALELYTTMLHDPQFVDEAMENISLHFDHFASAKDSHINRYVVIPRLKAYVMICALRGKVSYVLKTQRWLSTFERNQHPSLAAAVHLLARNGKAMEAASMLYSSDVPLARVLFRNVFASPNIDVETKRQFMLSVDPRAAHLADDAVEQYLLHRTQMVDQFSRADFEKLLILICTGGVKALISLDSVLGDMAARGCIHDQLPLMVTDHLPERELKMYYDYLTAVFEDYGIKTNKFLEKVSLSPSSSVTTTIRAISSTIPQTPRLPPEIISRESSTIEKHLTEGRIELARRTWNNLIRLHTLPDRRATCNLMRKYSVLNQYEEAMAICEQAVNMVRRNRTMYGPGYSGEVVTTALEINHQKSRYDDFVELMIKFKDEVLSLRGAVAKNGILKLANLLGRFASIILNSTIPLVGAYPVFVEISNVMQSFKVLPTAQPSLEEVVRRAQLRIACDTNDVERAMTVFRSLEGMQHTQTIYVALLKMLAKSNDEVALEEVFGSMMHHTTSITSIEPFNVVMGVYAKSGNKVGVDRIMKTIDSIKFKPDSETCYIMMQQQPDLQTRMGTLTAMLDANLAVGSRHTDLIIPAMCRTEKIDEVLPYMESLVKAGVGLGRESLAFFCNELIRADRVKDVEKIEQDFVWIYGIPADISVSNALIDYHLKKNDFESASRIFARSVSPSNADGRSPIRNSETYTLMFEGVLKIKDFTNAQKVLEQAQMDGIPEADALGQRFLEVRLQQCTLSQSDDSTGISRSVGHEKSALSNSRKSSVGRSGTGSNSHPASALRGLLKKRHL
ncbi:hypothetical protein SeLEV6574_g05239 [Synchytrium endobioticum]|uniref:Pentacotripeptide-repeat region of PRORP domain-containing protein n=1 Tax=Synchytrium endobioticum TaxID=286115 RepID=A0A507CW71_9FUNG|nr:hypothetical protein SeLEV6574_g05239 [Synchytrium endobioticum]